MQGLKELAQTLRTLRSRRQLSPGDTRRVGGDTLALVFGREDTGFTNVSVCASRYCVYPCLPPPPSLPLHCTPAIGGAAERNVPPYSECVLLLQNVFSYYRTCSLTTYGTRESGRAGERRRPGASSHTHELSLRYRVPLPVPGPSPSPCPRFCTL